MAYSLRDIIKQGNTNPLVRSLNKFAWLDKEGVLNFLDSCNQNRQYVDVIPVFIDALISAVVYYSDDEYTKKLYRSILALFNYELSRCIKNTKRIRKEDNFTNDYIESQELAKFRDGFIERIELLAPEKGMNDGFLYSFCSQLHSKIIGNSKFADGNLGYKQGVLMKAFSSFKEGSDFIKLFGEVATMFNLKS